MFPASAYFDLQNTLHSGLFDPEAPAWEALKRIHGYLAVHLKPAVAGDVSDSAVVGDHVFVGKGTVVEPGATILGPAWIGADCVVRAGAYVRNDVIIGDRCVLGNSCEFKNCVLLDEVEVPHFSYVGDAVMGTRSHLGAGVILSNVKLDRGEIFLRNGEEKISTGLRKFSAVIGDGTEIGCNSIVSPGSLIGKNCVLYPGTHWTGLLADSRIVKVRQTQQIVERMP